MTDEQQRATKPQVIPYVRRTSHNLKKVANKYGIKMVFSAPVKLAGMCSRIAKGNKKLEGCGKKYALRGLQSGCRISNTIEVWQSLRRADRTLYQWPYA